MPKYISINIAIVPDESVTKRAITLSRSLRKVGGLFTLNQRLYSSHVTVYMVDVPARAVAPIRSAIQQIAKRTAALQLLPVGWRQGKSGYVNVTYKRSPSLRRFQSAVVEAVNEYRGGYIRPGLRANMKSFSLPAQKNIRRYGFPTIGQLYEPHLTLTRLEKYVPQVKPKGDVSKMKFRATHIGIFRSGEHGVSTKQILKVRLRGDVGVL